MSGETLVAGLGKSGQSALHFLAAQGVAIRAADSRFTPPGLDELRTQLPELPVDLGPFDDELFCSVERIVLSPGISRWHPGIEQAAAAGVEIIGDVELFARHVKGAVIAITGSNGKSTVTTLVAQMAADAGIDVRVGGNLGTPILDLLNGEPAQLYVVELSSFQLETTRSLRPLAAVVLNVSPDHMDRYRDFAHYAQTKGSIYDGAARVVYPYYEQWVNAWVHQSRYQQPKLAYGVDQPEGDVLYGVVDDQEASWLYRGSERLLPVTELKIAGKHNWGNALAALALGEAADIPLESMVGTLRRFRGLSHRTEWIMEWEEVRWVNDSKGTNVGAAMAAIEGLSIGAAGKIIWIGGGQGKGADFTPLRPLAERHIRTAILMGEDREEIAAALGDVVVLQRVSDIDEAVAVAGRTAQSGDTVLLSPACASFDQFSGFEARGDAFKASVSAWVGERS